MINREDFEFQKSIVEWLVASGIEFKIAMITMSYSLTNKVSIFEAFADAQVKIYEEKQKLSK